MSCEKCRPARHRGTPILFTNESQHGGIKRGSLANPSTFWLTSKILCQRRKPWKTRIQVETMSLMSCMDAFYLCKFCDYHFSCKFLLDSCFLPPILLRYTFCRFGKSYPRSRSHCCPIDVRLMSDCCPIVVRCINVHQTGFKRRRNGQSSRLRLGYTE